LAPQGSGHRIAGGGGQTVAEDGVQHRAFGGAGGSHVLRPVGVQRAHDADRDRHDEQRDHQATDRAEAGLGMTGQAAGRDQPGRAVRAAGGDAGDGHGQPRPGHHQPDHHDEDAGQVGHDLTVRRGRPAAHEVRELGQTGEQRHDAPGARRTGGGPARYAQRRHPYAP